MFNFFSSKAKKYEDIPAGPFHDLMAQPNSVVIDVRTAGEFAGGKLRGLETSTSCPLISCHKSKTFPKTKPTLSTAEVAIVAHRLVISWAKKVLKM